VFSMHSCYAIRDIPAGKAIFDIHRKQMLTANGDYNKEGEKAGISPGLASALHRERKNPSNSVMKACVSI
jgi:hypothetical protein